MKRQAPLVSIIVPVYNGESTIKKLVDSVLIQSYKNFELIIVNDGSDDNTFEIINELSHIHTCIQIIDQKKNQGVSTARNVALDKAKGEWIWFVDADDELLPDGLYNFISALESDTDLVMADYITDPPKTDRLNMDIPSRLTRLQAAELLFSSAYNRFWGYLWCKLFKLSIIKKYSLRFNTSLDYNEDSLFIFEYLSCAETGAVAVKSPVYKYTLSDVSTMAKINGRHYARYETDLDACMLMADISYKFHSSKITNLVKKRLYGSYRKNRELIVKYGHNDSASKKRIYKKIRTRLSLAEIVSIVLTIRMRNGFGYLKKIINVVYR